MGEPDSPLFSYCLEVQGREFTIYVSHDGVIYWDDYQNRRAARSPEGRFLEVRATIGDGNARKRLDAETEEYTISFHLPEVALTKVREAARRFDRSDWTDDDEADLDKVLEPLFWSEVNPYINAPLRRP